jgi:hypothetical protein
MTTYETIEVYGSEVFYRKAGDRRALSLAFIATPAFVSGR